MSDDDEPTVTDLVVAALEGDEAAWERLVERYTPLMVSVLRRYRLTGADAEDVGQIVLLRLLEHLPGLREPRALPMWLITTTRNESVRMLRTTRRVVPFDPAGAADDLVADTAEPDAALLRVEVGEGVLEALAELPERDRALLLLLSEDPPIPYKEIAVRLGMPVGSIGPTRARALDKLRSSPAIAALAGSEPGRRDRDDATVGRR